ncbi:coiled-coil domain-containing protein 137 [Bradysia coprophila]|uniref:coiled-coil domain-containing protein 137 n=1 Tax=Bradysia coprophila TaxID=38358 RepID=UPI00187D959B|nr:coiled-coil domain-containing protein 137 [Bradysia coprophila]
MGRKIPARKHHGVRDPIKQNQQRLALIKDKINNPPEKQDFQKVSHKLANFIKLKEEAKSGNFKLKRPKDEEDKPENYTKKPKQQKQADRHSKELPSIHRYQNESDEDYLRRVNRITRESIQESQFEAKYGVEVIRNRKTGEIKLKKRPKDELEEQMKKARKDSAMGDKKKDKKIEVKITPAEQKKLVKEMIAQRKEKDKQNKPLPEYNKDEIKFGEVAHCPPQLTTPRKATKSDTVPRPGKKNLLLHSVISGAVEKEQPKANKATKLPSFDLKGKRKELPMATRQMIENQQKNVVEMYRQLKKKNRTEMS